MNDNLSHTCWKCKYHIVFAPKYRRKTIYGTLKSDIGKILRQLCELKKVEIHEDIMRDTRGLSFFMSENKKWFAS